VQADQHISRSIADGAAKNRKRGIRYPGPIALLLVWTLIGTLSYGRHYLQDHSSQSPADISFEFLGWLTCFLPWAALSPVVFRLERKYPLSTARWSLNLVKLTVAGLAMAYVGAEAALGLGVGIDFVFRRPLDIPPHWWMPLMKELWVILLIYWLTVLAGYVIRNLIHLHEREQEAAELALQKSQLESSLRQAELETLRTRLNPHFLFNCLQNIAVLTQENPKTANQMLTRLGELLRNALRGDARPETSLESEIALTKSYVAVEKVRFGERLSVLFDIAPETQSALVPTFLLQPLIENAILHGLRGISRAGAIVVHSIVESDTLVLTVTDNGNGLPVTNISDLETGVGLTSTCERLQGMYPEQHSFAIRTLPEGGTEVQLVLPLRLDGTHAGVMVDEQTSFVDRR
jgi:two-component system LytT family sensor kinase